VLAEGPDTLVIVALILALGVAAQVLADRFRVPSVLFLILAGVAVGPKGLSSMIALVSSADENTVPEVSQEIHYGDHLTVLGRTDAVYEAIERLHPHD
jgi:Kef-type K+ transport system membrane component KefB